MSNFSEEKSINFSTFKKLLRAVKLTFKDNNTVLFHVSGILKLFKKDLPRNYKLLFLQNAASEAVIEMRRAIHPYVENFRVIKALSSADGQSKKALLADARKEERKSLALELWRRFWRLDVIENTDFRKQN
ncbi:MAG: hypothetical protein ABIG60_00390 [Patescibacteria group bacterium]